MSAAQTFAKILDDLKERYFDLLEVCMGQEKLLLEVNQILGPQIDLLKIAEKYGTYRIHLTYEQIKKLRELTSYGNSGVGEDKK